MIGLEFVQVEVAVVAAAVAVVTVRRLHQVLTQTAVSPVAVVVAVAGVAESVAAN